MYLLDARTPDPGVRVPAEDIIGAVKVADGKVVAGSYQHNPRHRLLTVNGWFRLAPLRCGSGGRGPVSDGNVVDLDATFDQQLLNVAVGQIEPQIPAHRDDDDLGREPEAGERRLRR